MISDTGQTLTAVFVSIRRKESAGAIIVSICRTVLIRQSVSGKSGISVGVAPIALSPLSWPISGDGGDTVHATAICQPYSESEEQWWWVEGDWKGTGCFATHCLTQHSLISVCTAITAVRSFNCLRRPLLTLSASPSACSSPTDFFFFFSTCLSFFVFLSVKSVQAVFVGLHRLTAFTLFSYFHHTKLIVFIFVFLSFLISWYSLFGQSTTKT